MKKRKEVWFYMTGYEYLKSGLVKKNMTQLDLAEKLKVSESTVQKWCVGKNSIPADRIAEIACVLDISPLLLLGIDVKSDDCYRKQILPYVTVNEDILRLWNDDYGMVVVSSDVMYDCLNFMYYEWLEKYDKSLSENDIDDLKFKKMEILTYYNGVSGFQETLDFFQKECNKKKLFVHFYHNVNLFEHLLYLTIRDLENDVYDSVYEKGLLGHPRVEIESE